MWIVLATAFLYGTAEVFADTAGSTLLPMLVRPADLGIGNARLQTGFLVGNQLAGPPLGAFLFAIGSFWPFLVQILCVSLAVILISRIARTPVPPKEAVPAGAKAHPIREGLRWLRGNAPVRTLVIIIFVFNVTWAAPWSILVLYATEHLNMGAVGFGALMTASALGGLVGTASFGWLERHVSFATLMRVCLSLEVLMHLGVRPHDVGCRRLRHHVRVRRLRVRLGHDLDDRPTASGAASVAGAHRLGQHGRRVRRPRDRAAARRPHRPGVGSDGTLVVRLRGIGGHAAAGLALDLAHRGRSAGARGRRAYERAVTHGSLPLRVLQDQFTACRRRQLRWPDPASRRTRR